MAKDKATSQMPAKAGSDTGELILYQTEDQQTRVQVRLLDETVWLNQQQMAELFQTSVPNISMHIKNCFNEGELAENSVVKDFLITASDNKEYKTKHYNLDVIISVGYRVKSHRGTQFRIWATKRLREYIVKGFALDDVRLKEGAVLPTYFDELLSRIRDIRSSEKNFYRKVQDIYTTSIDYDPSTDLSKEFFATVQNKLHWAVAGKTAAEIIHSRADASKANMGLTSWGKAGSESSSTLRKQDIKVAKNYLTEEELETLNLLVSQYLDFAELQAKRKKAMHMADWRTKLDDFLKTNDMEILTNAGSISKALAEETADSAYQDYTQQKDLEDNSALHPDLKKLIESKKPEGSKS